MELTHLLYVDEIIVFCEANQEQMRYLRVILVVFEAYSGLKVNWRKGSIFPVKEVQQIQTLANILRCMVEKLPTVYLGKPLGTKHPEIWDGIIEKIERKLALWKSQYLSLGGRFTLINFMLDSLPTYVMSRFPIPSEVIKTLIALRRNFLSQGNKTESSFNLVKWSSSTRQELWGFGSKESQVAEQKPAKQVAMEVQPEGACTVERGDTTQIRPRRAMVYR